MNAPAKIGAPKRPGPPPELLAFVEALARANVARDIAAADRKGIDRADGHLREIL